MISTLHATYSLQWCWCGFLCASIIMGISNREMWHDFCTHWWWCWFSFGGSFRVPMDLDLVFRRARCCDVSFTFLAFFVRQMNGKIFKLKNSTEIGNRNWRLRWLMGPFRWWSADLRPIRGVFGLCLCEVLEVIKPTMLNSAFCLFVVVAFFRWFWNKITELAWLGLPLFSFG